MSGVVGPGRDGSALGRCPSMDARAPTRRTTQVRFWSGNIEKDVAEYDTATFKTVNHIVTSKGVGRSAWFKDPGGNTIALFPPE